MSPTAAARSSSSVRGTLSAAAALIGVLFCFLCSSYVYAGQATLAWDANPQPEVAGYMLHYGTVSGSYTSTIDVGKVTQYDVTGLLDGKTYYYAVTAYDLSRVESGYSNEATNTIASAQPVASFSASATSGSAPLAVTFTSTSSGAITSYAWTFGDGASSTAQNPSHTYAAAGTFSVGLTVTGPGGTTTQTRANLISVAAASGGGAPPPGTLDANFSANVNSGPAPLNVTFTNTATGSYDYIRWEFGDGVKSWLKSVSHKYTTPGVYTVRQVIRGNGIYNIETKLNYITVTAPTATGTSPNLVAAYGFNEGTGTAVGDASGKGNSGVISNATWSVSGRFGKALAFNGTTSRVNINDAAALDLTNGMTLEAWVYPTALMQGWRSVVMKEQTGGAVYYLAANTQNNVPANGVYSGAEQVLYGSAQVPANAWTHLAATYDGAAQRIYVNGVQVATRAQTGALPNSTGALRIGGNSVWGEYFQGLIDEVRIYNRALSTAEIQSDMGTPVGGAQ
jgi:PKD repeat protein